MSPSVTIQNRKIQQSLGPLASQVGLARHNGDDPPPAGGLSAPQSERQTNLTDPRSAIMCVSAHHEYRQPYNAQALVGADGSQLVLAANVLSMTNDRESLERIIDQVSDTLGRPTTLLADVVYAGEAVVDALEQHGIEPLIFITLQIEPRTYDFRPPKMPDKDKTPPRITAPWRLAFMEKLQTAQAKHKYPN